MIKQNKKINKNKKNKGIALVVAVTSMTLLLSLSISISNIVLRQLRITSINNSSKAVFFTADSAAECVRYFDTIKKKDSNDNDLNEDFDNSIFGNNDFVTANPADQQDFLKDMVKCGNTEISQIEKTITGGNTAVTIFDIDYGQTCAKVEISKTDSQTKILTRGYNTKSINGAGCDLSNVDARRIVERGLILTY